MGIFSSLSGALNSFAADANCSQSAFLVCGWPPYRGAAAGLILSWPLNQFAACFKAFNVGFARATGAYTFVVGDSCGSTWW